MLAISVHADIVNSTIRQTDRRRRRIVPPDHNQLIFDKLLQFAREKTQVKMLVTRMRVSRQSRSVTQPFVIQIRLVKLKKFRYDLLLQITS
jgi:hypothetical protein